MARVKFTSEHKRNTRSVLNSPVYMAPLIAAGEAAAAQTAATAKRSRRPRGKGDTHIADHYKVRVDTNAGANRDRLEVTVYNDHKAAIAEELGHLTKKGTWVPGSHNLARTAEGMAGPGVRHRKAFGA